MYQFIVATRRTSGTCVGPEISGWSSGDIGGGGGEVQDISTMSLAGNGTNKWASRAVVALQLAAWSAVGIVLLEKGVTSLQKSPPTSSLNVTQEITTTPISSSDSHSQIFGNPTSIERLSHNDMDTLSVLPIEGDESNRNTKKSWRENEDNLSEGNRKTSTESSVSGANKTVDINPRQHLEQKDGKVPYNQWNNNDQSSQLNVSQVIGDKIVAVNVSEVNEENKQRMKEDENKRPSQEDKVWPNPVTIKEIIDNLEEHRWESRKRLRVARINNGGGAAAAVAMVAVGAVMLILGPAVIILRALDERRQERRFLKLSGEEDLPPSYEEATSEIDQAPTYSSLNLDSIVGNPIPPNFNDDSGNNSCTRDNCRRGSCC